MRLCVQAGRCQAKATRDRGRLYALVAMACWCRMAPAASRWRAENHGRCLKDGRLAPGHRQPLSTPGMRARRPLQHAGLWADINQPVLGETSARRRSSPHLRVGAGRHRGAIAGAGNRRWLPSWAVCPHSCQLASTADPAHGGTEGCAACAQCMGCFWLSNTSLEIMRRYGFDITRP